MFALACCGFAALALAGPGPTFTDRGGDAGGAPDVRAVTVESDQSALKFTIQTSGSWTDAIAFLRVDTDGDPSTGNAFGETGFEAVYVLHSLHTDFTLELSNGATVRRPQATWELSGSSLTISAPLSELAITAPTIGFRVATPAPGGVDEAPDNGLPEWRFTPGATVTSIAATFTPRVPRHGKSFAVTRVTTRFSDGNKGTATARCSAKLGRTTLRGACRWRLPVRARGKKLRVSVAAADVRRAYSLRVR